MELNLQDTGMTDLITGDEIIEALGECVAALAGAREVLGDGGNLFHAQNVAECLRDRLVKQLETARAAKARHEQAAPKPDNVVETRKPRIGEQTEKAGHGVSKHEARVCSMFSQLHELLHEKPEAFERTIVIFVGKAGDGVHTATRYVTVGVRNAFEAAGLLDHAKHGMFQFGVDPE